MFCIKNKSISNNTCVFFTKCFVAKQQSCSECFLLIGRIIHVLYQSRAFEALKEWGTCCLFFARQSKKPPFQHIVPYTLLIYMKSGPSWPKNPPLKAGHTLFKVSTVHQAPFQVPTDNPVCRDQIHDRRSCLSGFDRSLGIAKKTPTMPFLLASAVRSETSGALRRLSSFEKGTSFCGNRPQVSKSACLQRR